MSGEFVLLACALLGAGAVSGTLAGLFGVGGGSIVVAALYHAFTAVDVPEAARMPLSFGTAFAIMAPTSATSFLGHLRRGSADRDVARRWVLPVTVGVCVGSAVATRLSAVPLQAIFVALVLLNAVKLLTGWPAWQTAQATPSPSALNVSGFVIGAASSLIGIGGGVFGNMFLTAYGRTIHQAIGTTASLGAVISLVGVINYAVLGQDAHVDLPGSVGFVSLLAAAIIAPVAAATAPLGVRLAHRFTRRQLRIGFGLFLMTIALRFAYVMVWGG